MNAKILSYPINPGKNTVLRIFMIAGKPGFYKKLFTDHQLPN